MANLMVPQNPTRPLRVLRGLLHPAPDGAVAEHLHYDRNTRAWRRHEHRAAAAAFTAELHSQQECA